MKTIIQLVAAACVGALVAFVVPLNVLYSTFSTAQELGVSTSSAIHELGVSASSAVHALGVSTSSTAHALGVRVSEIKLADLNPLPGLFDWEQDKILAGEAFQQLGFQASAVTLKPVSIPTTSSHFDVGRYSGNGIYAPMQHRIDQNNRRMVGMRNSMNNPAGWHGAPPH